MNYYEEIKFKLLNNETYERVKDYSKERHRVITYFEIGRLLYEAGSHYGEGIIKQYSTRLSKELGAKYNERTLQRMRQFYVIFSDPKWSSLLAKPGNDQIQKDLVLGTDLEIKNTINKGNFERNNIKSDSLGTDLELAINRKWSPMGTELDNTQIASPMVTQLTWSHYRALLSLKDINEIQYYMNICIQNHLTKRQLEEMIKNKEYQRLPIEAKNKLIVKKELNIKDLVPNPILIKNNNNVDVYNEKILHNLIMEDISSFMKELGEGYSFIESEYRIKIDDRYNYIDFLLYNIKFRCYVVIELKVTEFKSEYVGQITKYMNYVDKNIRSINEDNTIGIIICKKNNGFYMEYVSDERIIAREYRLI